MTPPIKKYVEDLWQRIVASQKLDIQSVEKLAGMVNADTLQHSNVREIGAENICHNTWDKLQLTELLLTNGFTNKQAALAATQVISRAVYPASELKTTSWIKENSAVCVNLPGMTWTSSPKTNSTKMPCIYMK